MSNFFKDAISKLSDVKRKLPSFRKRDSSSSWVSQHMWADSSTLTDDVFDELYERHGLTFKIVNRLVNDCFKKWLKFESNNKDFVKKVELLNSYKKEGLKIRSRLKKARNCALRHGYCVLFLGYKDQSESLADEPKSPQSIEYIKVIRKRWVKKIVLDEDEESSTHGEIKEYVLDPNYFDTVEEVRIHAKRCILVRNGDDDEDPEGMSLLKPAYNWLNMFDNVAWSIGQSFFRYAGGFPVMKLKGWNNLSDTEKERELSIWAKVNSSTGWIIDQDSGDIKFEGAAGRALNPTSYFEAAMKCVASSLNLPYALIVGVQAGQVTGSETNLVDYYSDIHTVQALEIQPVLEDIYDRLMDTGQLPKAEYETVWNPLFEMDEKDKVEIEKMEAERDKILIESGVFLAEEIKKLRGYDKQLAGSDTRKRVKVDRSKKKIRSKFAADKYTKLSVAYFSELKIVFKDIERLAINIVKGYNTDSVDALEGKYQKILKSLETLFSIQNKQFSGVVENHIGNAFTLGWESAKEELKIELKPVLKARNLKLDVVKNEHLQVLKNVSEDIKKEVGVIIGKFTLNPSKNFKKIAGEIRHAFDVKMARVEMGVGNEVNSALNQGNLLGYETQAKILGTEDSSVIVAKEWVSWIDDRTTDTCVSLNGEVVPIGESFSSGDYAPPASDPPHACRSSLRSVSLAEARRIGLM